MPVKAIILAKKRSDLTQEQFRKQYDDHVAFGVKNFGHLWLSYKRNFLGPATCLEAAWTAGEVQTEAPYDVVAELVLKDMSAFEEQGRITEERGLAPFIVEDEKRTFDRAATCIMISEVVETEIPQG